MMILLMIILKEVKVEAEVNKPLYEKDKAKTVENCG